MKIKKIKIKDGDFVVVKGGSIANNTQLAMDLARKIPPKCIVWFLAEGQTIETLDEKIMKKAGWIKTDKELNENKTR